MAELSMEEIVTIMRNRQASNSRLLDHMIEVRNRYNADWVLPAVTADDVPEQSAGVPLLIAETIDNLGMRAASVLPDVRAIALDPDKMSGVRSYEFAQVRRKAVGYSWAKSRMNLALRRAYRHIAGYATATLVVVPDLRAGLPIVECRDPLLSYPEPKAPEDLTPIRNCGFVYSKATEWIRSTYPQARTENGGVVPPVTSTDEAVTWDLVEWVDEYCTVIGVLGPTEWRDRSGRVTSQPARPMEGMAPQHFELSRVPNLTGMCPAATPRRVTLDSISSQVAQVTGIVDLMARLQALQIIAAEKAIFPDRYIIGEATRTPRLVNGDWADGRTGEVNLLMDAKSIGSMPSTPDPVGQQMIDRLERNVRVSTGLNPTFGGETYGSLRTGRGIDSMLSASVDPRIQEMQEVMVPELEQINECILETYRSYWPRRKYTVFAPLSGDTEASVFVPGQHVESPANAVVYPFPGMDVQGVTIILGQLYGMKAVSLDTVRRRHPNISDAEAEQKRVEHEVLEQTVLESLAQQAQAGTLSPAYLAKVARHRQKSDTMFDAVEKADAEVRAEQAKQADEAAAQQPGAPASEMLQPGLAPPGAPAPVMPLPPGAPLPPAGPEGIGPLPAIPGEVGPNKDQRGFRRLMEALSANPPSQPA